LFIFLSLSLSLPQSLYKTIVYLLNNTNIAKQVAIPIGVTPSNSVISPMDILRTLTGGGNGVSFIIVEDIALAHKHTHTHPRIFLPNILPVNSLSTPIGPSPSLILSSYISLYVPHHSHHSFIINTRTLIILFNITFIMIVIIRTMMKTFTDL